MTTTTRTDAPAVRAASNLAIVSRWIDEHPSNASRDREAATWGRLAKVAEESGEVIAAYIGATGQNPRKGVTASTTDVCKELLDVAITALAAYEHMTGNNGRSMTALFDYIDDRMVRVGLVPR